MNKATLILSTSALRSVRETRTQLEYTQTCEEFVILALQRTDKAPKWFLNLIRKPEASFEIAGEVCRGTWRIITGSERESIWDGIAIELPPYAEYQIVTKREIPLVALKKNFASFTT